MIDLKGIGATTVATFFAEVWDVNKYSHPKQDVNMAGLSHREHSSDQYKGQTRINKRGRKILKKVLYLAIRPMVRYNPTFRALMSFTQQGPIVL